jgi:hypothetical protein
MDSQAARLDDPQLSFGGIGGQRLELHESVVRGIGTYRSRAISSASAYAILYTAVTLVAVSGYQT